MKTNIIVLGRAAPELFKGRQSVTVVGYSAKHGFVRLYPTRIDSPLKQWSICTVDIERHPGDKRRESFRLLGKWEKLNDSIKPVGVLSHAQRMFLARKLARQGIESLSKGTIAVIRPFNITPHIESAGQRKVQKTLTKFDIINKNDYEARLMIQYNCSKECRRLHKHWVIEWGVYEALRKNPEEREKMLASLHLNNPEYEKYFVLGGKANRKQYVIVSVLRFKRGLKSAANE